jgi:hypothetical protein
MSASRIVGIIYAINFGQFGCQEEWIFLVKEKCTSLSEQL